MKNFNHEGLGYTPPKNDKGKILVQKKGTKFVNPKGKSKVCVKPKCNYLVKCSEKVKGRFQVNFDPSYVPKRDGYGGVYAKYVGPWDSCIPYKDSI